VATNAGNGSTEATAPIGHGMAGPAQQVYVSRASLDSKPRPWDLTTPESAVRSYLDWTSYAYRIAQSEVASPTMSTYEAVRVDSYNQYNLQKGRLIDQTLTSISFGKPSVGTTSTLLPAVENWTYKYVAITATGETVGGPYTVKYDSVYTVIGANGGWVVDAVKTKAAGEVK
jgi:hypothetical protein